MIFNTQIAGSGGGGGGFMLTIAKSFASKFVTAACTWQPASSGTYTATISSNGTFDDNSGTYTMVYFENQGGIYLLSPTMYNRVIQGGWTAGTRVGWYAQFTGTEVEVYARSTSDGNTLELTITES